MLGLRMLQLLCRLPKNYIRNGDEINSEFGRDYCSGH